MSARSASRWVVVKFGGTSVSTLANWRNIALVVKRRLEAGNRVLVVHSAITKITDMLEKLLAAAQAGRPEEALKAIEDRHRQLTTELGVGVSPQLQGYFDELTPDGQWHRAGARTVGSHARARDGERRADGHRDRCALPEVAGHRRHLDGRARHARGRGSRRLGQGLGALGHLLDFAPDAALEARLDASTPVVITQGFIARDSEGNTCLLGRGGSDTSAAYLGAKLARQAHRDLDRRARHVQRQSARHADARA